MEGLGSRGGFDAGARRIAPEAGALPSRFANTPYSILENALISCVASRRVIGWRRSFSLGMFAEADKRRADYDQNDADPPDPRNVFAKKNHRRKRREDET